MRIMREISQKVGDMPIILYQTSLGGLRLSPEEIGAMAREVPIFIGMKDATCDIPTLKAMLDCGTPPSTESLGFSAGVTWGFVVKALSIWHSSTA